MDPIPGTGSNIPGSHNSGRQEARSRPTRAQTRPDRVRVADRASGPGRAYKTNFPVPGSGSKPYEFIGFGDIEGPKPYEFIGFGDTDDPKLYEFIRLAGISKTQENP